MNAFVVLVRNQLENQKIINLDQFTPRPYQQKLVNAFEEGKIKRFVAIWPRRAGKIFAP